MLICTFLNVIPVKAMNIQDYMNFVYGPNCNLLHNMIPAIHPFYNPAEDNWLSREIAIKVFEDESRFDELTQEHFNSISEISCMINGEFNIPEGVIPRQIGNLINIQSISIATNRNIYLKLPKEIGTLRYLNFMSLGGFISDEEGLKELNRLSNLKELFLLDNKIRRLPKEIGYLPNLKHLRIYDSLLDNLPIELCNLYNLNRLYVKSNISYIPHWIFDFANLKRNLVCHFYPYS